MSLQELIDVTRFYGVNPDYVLAGGGNTSLKEKGIMYVKASGSFMSDAVAQSFVKMSQEKLDALWSAEYPEDKDERENQALADLMAARLEGETARPSVETLLHSFIPCKYVVHTHPAFVNAVSCSVNGKAWAEQNLGDKLLWIPVVNPGYILAKYVKDRVDEHLASGKDFPEYIILQNHGVFTGGESIPEVHQKYEYLMGILEKDLKITPRMAEKDLSGTAPAKSLKKAVQEAYAEDCGFEYASIQEVEPWLVSKEASAPVWSSLTPDHIVYMGHEPLWVPEGSIEDMQKAIVEGVSQYEKSYGKKPKTLLIQNQGIISCGMNAKEARLSAILFRDAVKVSVLTENFGGVQFMPQDKIDFINTWEVEKYRAKESTQ